MCLKFKCVNIIKIFIALLVKSHRVYLIADFWVGVKISELKKYTRKKLYKHKQIVF